MFSFVAVHCLVGVHLGVCHALLGRSPRRTICVTCEDVIFFGKNVSMFLTILQNVENESVVCDYGVRLCCFPQAVARLYFSKCGDYSFHYVFDYFNWFRDFIGSPGHP